MSPLRSRAETLRSFEAALRGPLPGRTAHLQAWPAELPDRGLEIASEELRPAAVLLGLLFQQERGQEEQGQGERRPEERGNDERGQEERGRFRIPLIRRPPTMAQHAGQIAFPGGTLEDAETPRECALRETFEEIGLAAGEVEILGRLSPVVIPVTGFRVETFVGSIAGTPAWSLKEEEVAELLFADPDELAAKGPSARIERKLRDGRVWSIPAFPVGEVRVWGATALMLAEFLWVWRSLPAE